MKIFNKEMVEAASDNYKKRSDRIWYQNIKGLRKDNIKYDFSREEILEYARCYSDPVYFIEKYFKIPTMDGYQNIILRDYQKKLLLDLIYERNTITKGSRQIGISVVIDAAILYLITFRTNIVIEKCTYRKLSSLDSLREHIKNIPFYMQPGIIKFTKFEILFKNNISIVAGPMTDEQLRETHNLNKYIFVDNAGYLDDTKMLLIDDTEAAQRHYLTTGTEQSEAFFDIYIKASINNEYKITELNWYKNKEFDLEWYSNQVKLLGKDLFKQYYEI